MIELKNKKISAVKADFEIESITSKTLIRKKRKKDTDYERYINLGMYLVTPLLLGVFLGHWVDTVYKIGRKGILLGIVVGAAGTFYNLFRMIKDTE